MTDLLARRGFLRGLAHLPLVGGGVTLLGNPTAAAEPVTLDLLRSYSAWLHFECRFLSWELCGDDKSRFDVEDAVVWATNPEFSFHKGGTEGPPSTRAAVVLSAVGCGWREGDLRTPLRQRVKQRSGRPRLRRATHALRYWTGRRSWPAAGDEREAPQGAAAPQCATLPMRFPIPISGKHRGGKPRLSI